MRECCTFFLYHSSRTSLPSLAMENVFGFTIRALCFGALALLLTSLANKAIKIAQNRKLARELVGIPIVISPFDSVNPAAKVLKLWLAPMFKRLRPVLGNWTRYSQNVWTFEDKYQIHSELGDVFTFISPRGMALYLADPDAVQDILRRRRDFPKPVHRYGSSFPSRKISKAIACLRICQSNHERIWTESHYSKRLVGGEFCVHSLRMAFI